jgi:tetratricopeptide (TPR) repeat protein
MRSLKIITVLVLVVFAGAMTGMASPEKKDKRKKEAAEQGITAPAWTSTAAVALLIDAKKEELTGNTKRAMEILRDYISKYPDGPTGYYELGQLLADDKQSDEGQKMALKAVELDPENVWYQVFLAEVCQQNGDYKQAIEVYSKILDKHPDKIEYYYRLATLYLVTNHLKEAVDVYDRLENKTGISEEISLQKEKILLDLKEPDRARKELENLVDAYPDNPRYLSILAEFYMDAGQRDKAFDLYKKIAALDPGNPYIHMSLADYYRKTGDRQKAFEELKLGFANPSLDIDTKVNILLSFYSANQVTDEFIKQAFELSEILVQTHPKDPKSHSIYGDLLLQDKKYNEAKSEFLKVIALDSSKYVVWEELIRLDVQLENYKDMADHSQKAIELFPDQPFPYLISGISNYQLKDYDKSQKALNRGVKLVVDNDELLAQFYMYLGDTYNAMKKPAESDQSYEKSLQINSKNAYVLNNYSYYLSLRNANLTKAEEMSKKAVTLEPDNTSFMDTYGWVLFKLGRYAEAKEWIGKALNDKDGVSAEVMEHYGDVLFKLGDTGNAVEYWIKARNNPRGKGSDNLEKKIAEKKLYE